MGTDRTSLGHDIDTNSFPHASFNHFYFANNFTGSNYATLGANGREGDGSVSRDKNEDQGTLGYGTIEQDSALKRKRLERLPEKDGLQTRKKTVTNKKYNSNGEINDGLVKKQRTSPKKGVGIQDEKNNKETDADDDSDTIMEGTNTGKKQAILQKVTKRK